MTHLILLAIRVGCVMLVLAVILTQATVH